MADSVFTPENQGFRNLTFTDQTICLLWITYFSINNYISFDTWTAIFTKIWKLYLLDVKYWKPCLVGSADPLKCKYCIQLMNLKNTAFAAFELLYPHFLAARFIEIRIQGLECLIWSGYVRCWVNKFSGFAHKFLLLGSSYWQPVSGLCGPWPPRPWSITTSRYKDSSPIRCSHWIWWHHGSAVPSMPGSLKNAWCLQSCFISGNTLHGPVHILPKN